MGVESVTRCLVAVQKFQSEVIKSEKLTMQVLLFIIFEEILFDNIHI